MNEQFLPNVLLSDIRNNARTHTGEIIDSIHGIAVLYGSLLLDEGSEIIVG